MRAPVRGLDNLLSKLFGVFEFSDDPGCILRLSQAAAPHEIHLKDMVIQKHEPVLLIHMRNNHLMQIPTGGPDLAWAKKMLHSFRLSLVLAASYSLQNPDFSKTKAVGGATSLLLGGEHGNGARFMQSLGFTIVPYVNPLGRFGLFWENFYAWLMIWTYNPGSLPYRQLFRLHRTEFWMSYQDFLNRYALAKRGLPLQGDEGKTPELKGR